MARASKSCPGFLGIPILKGVVGQLLAFIGPAHRSGRRSESTPAPPSPQVTNECPASCTARLGQNLTVIQAGLHMHMAGTAIMTQARRPDPIPLLLSPCPRTVPPVAALPSPRSVRVGAFITAAAFPAFFSPTRKIAIRSALPRPAASESQDARIRVNQPFLS